MLDLGAGLELLLLALQAEWPAEFSVGGDRPLVAGLSATAQPASNVAPITSAVRVRRSLRRVAISRLLGEVESTFPNTNAVRINLTGADSRCRVIRQSLGRSAESIARSLGNVSYAEAEEFCRDVRQRLALSPTDGSLRAAVAERLALWKARARQRDSV